MPLPYASSRGVRPRNPGSGDGADRSDVNNSTKTEAVMTGDLIRVLLADDHAVVRAGLKAVLGTAKDITVVGEARNGREAVDAAARLNPDVVVMDLSMDEMDGAAATKELKARSSKCRVLIHAVRTVASGHQYLQAAAARTLAKELKRREEHASERDQFEKLSEREQAILRFVAAGYSAPEIGDKLNISPKTVHTYKQRVNEKIGLAHRADYVRFAMKLGLLGS